MIIDPTRIGTINSIDLTIFPRLEHFKIYFKEMNDTIIYMNLDIANCLNTFYVIATNNLKLFEIDINWGPIYLDYIVNFADKI